MKTRNYFFIVFSILLMMTSCQNTKSNEMKNKVEYQKDSQGKFIVNAPIVTKNFMKKNNTPTGIKEYYVQQSIQDYFIKFCESKIKKEDLIQHLSKIERVIKTAKIEIEILDGEWDICDGNKDQQSRMGKYVIIHRIIKE